MVATKYSYQKDTNLDKLDQEIRKNATITVALNRIDSPSAGNIDVWFKDVLPADQETELNTIVTNHVKEPLTDSPPLIEVLEQDSDLQKRTGAHFQASTLNVDVPAGSAGDVTSYDFSYPFPISILAAQFLSTADVVGDEVDFEVAPNTIIGALIEDVGVGETIIRVSQTVLDNTFVGAFLNLTDGTSVDSLGRVITIGADDGYGPESDLIKVETATVNSFLASSPTYVRQTIKMVHDFKVPAAGRIVIGETKIGSSYIPVNITLRLTYKNNDGIAKTFGIVLEYLY